MNKDDAKNGVIDDHYDDDDDDDIDDYDYDDDDDDEMDEDGDGQMNTTISFDSLVELKRRERKLGCDVCVFVSPSTITIKKTSGDDAQGEVLFECRIRYLSFMGISTDVR